MPLFGRQECTVGYATSPKSGYFEKFHTKVEKKQGIIIITKISGIQSEEFIS